MCWGENLMNRQPEQIIETYLDRLCAQLQALPLHIQNETREELRQHLQSLVAMQREPEQIVQSALRQFGDPVKIGQRIALQWEEGEWSLSRLPLLQRIEKIREAVALEAEKPTPALQAVSLVQFALMLTLAATFFVQVSSVAWLHLSKSDLNIARITLLGLYFLIGMVGCVLEWQRAHRATDAAPNGPHLWRNLLARGGMAILIPCTFLFQSMIHIEVTVALMIALNVIIVALGQRNPSRRARVASGASSVYGLLMGVFFAAFISMSSRVFGPGNLIWLSILPIAFVFGRWFWKGRALPPKKSRSA
jgi:hypothetical protein